MMSENAPHTPDRPAEVTEAELAVLRALWERGHATIRVLAGALYPDGGPSAHATVQKLLERLERKGCVSRRAEGRVNVYRPAVEREDLIDRSLRRTAEKLCDGSLAPLLTRLVEASGVDRRTVDELRELVERLERERGDAP